MSKTFRRKSKGEIEKENFVKQFQNKRWSQKVKNSKRHYKRQSNVVSQDEIEDAMQEDLETSFFWKDFVNGILS